MWNMKDDKTKEISKILDSMELPDWAQDQQMEIEAELQKHGLELTSMKVFVKTDMQFSSKEDARTENLHGFEVIVQPLEVTFIPTDRVSVTAVVTTKHYNFHLRTELMNNDWYAPMWQCHTCMGTLEGVIKYMLQMDDKNVPTSTKKQDMF